MIWKDGNVANLDRMLNSPEVSSGTSKKICKNGRLWGHNNSYHNQDKLRNSKNKPYKLIVHHIDLNKNNNAQRNLISLCRECHLKTHFEKRNGGGFIR